MGMMIAKRLSRPLTPEETRQLESLVRIAEHPYKVRVWKHRRVITFGRGFKEVVVGFLEQQMIEAEIGERKRRKKHRPRPRQPVRASPRPSCPAHLECTCDGLTRRKR